MDGHFPVARPQSIKPRTKHQLSVQLKTNSDQQLTRMTSLPLMEGNFSEICRQSPCPRPLSKQARRRTDDDNLSKEVKGAKSEYPEPPEANSTRVSSVAEEDMEYTLAANLQSIGLGGNFQNRPKRYETKRKEEFAGDYVSGRIVHHTISKSLSTDCFTRLPKIGSGKLVSDETQMSMDGRLPKVHHLPIDPQSKQISSDQLIATANRKLQRVSSLPSIEVNFYEICRQSPRLTPLPKLEKLKTDDNKLLRKAVKGAENERTGKVDCSSSLNISSRASSVSVEEEKHDILVASLESIGISSDTHLRSKQYEAKHEEEFINEHRKVVRPMSMSLTSENDEHLPQIGSGKLVYSEKGSIKDVYNSIAHRYGIL